MLFDAAEIHCSGLVFLGTFSRVRVLCVCSKVLEDCGLADDLLVQLTDDMVEYSLYYVCKLPRSPP